jgi:hypothetical protein
MGSNAFNPYRPSLLRTAKITVICSALALLSSCISDGPNQTGGQYLANQGILLQNSLYHIVLPSFPVDSFWTSESEPNHLGDTVLMAGISRNFSSQVRMAFDLADTTFLDSLSDSATSFHLSVGAVPTTGVGLTELIATVGDSASDTATYRDSLGFLVESWAIPNKNIDGEIQTDAQRRDTLSLYNRRFLIRQDTVAVLPAVTTRDTIKLQIKGAYTQNNFQAKLLPHLYEFLKPKSSTTKWLIQMQLTPLRDTVDKRPGMLRLGGNIGSTYGPVLLFGSPTSSLTATAKQKLGPLVASGMRGVNYNLRYSGSGTDILPAKNRNMHLQLDRASLLDSLEAALKRQGITPPSRSKGNQFDLTYFIPFAQISMPLADSLRLEGGLPIEMRLNSDLDSILPETPRGTISVFTILKDKSTWLLTKTESGNAYKILDSISILYRQMPNADSGIRQVIVQFAKDSSRNDSIFIHLGETKEIIIGKVNGSSPLVISASAQSSILQISYYLSSHSVSEPNDFKDPVTGKLLTTLSEKLPRLLRPAQNNLTLRATRGLQRILNRADAGVSIFPDLVIQPISQAVDDSVTGGGKTEPQRVPFPVLSVIPPKIVGGRLSVSIDLYLYPLKAER